MVEGDGTWASNDYPTRFTFHTTTDGASSATEKMRLDDAGNLLIGATSTNTGAFGFPVTISLVLHQHFV